MKIAFTTSGDDLTAALDSRFGRSPKFLVYDMDTDTYDIIDNNQNRNSTQGAGIQSAETVARCGVKVLVTGHCGPKAFRTLKAAGIKIYNSNADTISDALEMYRNGNLTKADAADVAGHWA